MTSTTVCTTVRFLNGDLVTYPYASDARDDLIDAICDTLSIHPLQVALCQGGDDRGSDEKEDKDNNVLNALIFPKKRVSLYEFRHIIRDASDASDASERKDINWEALDLEQMTNESVIGHLLSLPVGEIPHRLFANPHPIVVDFLHSSGIFRLDQTAAEIDEWFTTKFASNSLCIFLNPSDPIQDVLEKINPDALFQKYGEWVRGAPIVNREVILANMADLILTHPLATEEMTTTVIGHHRHKPFQYTPLPNTEKTWRYLCDVRHHPECKSHPDFLTTLTELLCDLQYTDAEVVF